MPESTNVALKATTLSNELMLNQLDLEDKHSEGDSLATKIRLKEIVDHLRANDDKHALSLQHKRWLSSFQKRRQDIWAKMELRNTQPGFNLELNDSSWFQNPLNLKIAKFCEDLDLGEIPFETEESEALFADAKSPGFHVADLKTTNENLDYSPSSSSRSSQSHSFSYNSEDDDSQPGTPRSVIRFAAPDLKRDISEHDFDEPGTPHQFNKKSLAIPLQAQINIAPAIEIKQQLAPEIKQQKAETKSIDETKLSEIVGAYRNVFRGYFHRIFSSRESKQCRAAMQKEAIIADLMVRYGCERKYITPDRVNEARYAIAHAYLAVPSNARRALAKALNANVVYKEDYKADFYAARKVEIDAEKAQEAKQKAEENAKARAELDKALNLDDGPQKQQAVAAAKRNLEQLDLKSKRDLYNQLHQAGAIRPSQHL